ncbi:MAG: DEAD/DEAH box helicase [Zoogloeaceae bacterium]|jgi:ATP-dependent RNA helicase RhlE|nr:DEAD/DEAH box helicase [Zoogloeaceae bacterium]
MNDTPLISPTPPAVPTFAHLGLSPDLLQAIAESGYTAPTPIQAQAIPLVLQGRDLMGGAQTGTGKTAAFALPILERLLPFANPSPSPAKHPLRALILTPTRELAQQIYESFQMLGKHVPLRVACAYGGTDIKPQIAELKRGAEILVATPGRLFDLFEQKALFFNQLSALVLDEADRMLDMGFLPDIRRLLPLLPANRQGLLFSATFPEEIQKLAQMMLKSPAHVEVARRNQVSETISHRVYLVPEAGKRALLIQLLREGEEHAGAIGQCIVFTRTKLSCSRLARELKRVGLAADALHGDRTQAERTKTLAAFKAGETSVLAATDVAARGLDIDNLPYVINYELPHVAEDYVHRIGRTGRAGHKGNALSLVCPAEMDYLSDIEKLIGKPIERAQPPRALDMPRQAQRPFSRRADPLLHPAIAADGFDFSKPYEPQTAFTTPDAPATVTTGKPARPAPFRKQRPVAALLRRTL